MCIVISLDKLNAAESDLVRNVVLSMIAGLARQTAAVEPIRSSIMHNIHDAKLSQ